MRKKENEMWTLRQWKDKKTKRIPENRNEAIVEIDEAIKADNINDYLIFKELIRRKKSK